MPVRRLFIPVLACTASFAAAAGATAALSSGTRAGTDGTETSAGAVRTIQQTVTTSRLSRGPTGARGPSGGAGAPGDPGGTGTTGPSGATVIASAFTINWQNNLWQGRESATFVAPGIGQGTVTCTPNIEHVTDSGKQMLEFRPYAQQVDTTMWTLRTDDRAYTYFDDPARAAESPIAVRAARREFNTGPQFNEGLNLKAFGPTYRAQGSFIGIISSRGDRAAIGGPGPAPTTFRVSWHWRFDDGNPRCYVAGTFFTEAT